MTSPDLSIRARAMRLLRTIPQLPDDFVDPLLANLEAHPPSIRPVAAWRLHEKFRSLPERAIEPLLRCLSGDPLLCVPVLACLRDRFQRLPRHAVPPLLVLLENERPVVRDLAVWTLLLRFARLPDDAARPLVRRLDDRTPEVRLGAALALALALKDRVPAVPATDLLTVAHRLKAERNPLIRAVLALALAFHRHHSPVLLPALLEAMVLDDQALRGACAAFYSYSGTLPDDDRGRFARLCLPRAFHASAARDMSSAPDVVQSPDLRARLRQLARSKYARRRSDFADGDDLLQTLQSQFAFVAARSPHFGTPLSRPLDLLDNAVRRVDSAFAYEFRSRFQGFAHRHDNVWVYEAVLPTDAAVFQQPSDPLGTIDAARRRELQHLLSSALGGLDERQRFLVGARLFDDLTWREIAERLGAPVSTVQSQLTQALTALRQALPSGADL